MSGHASHQPLQYPVSSQEGVKGGEVGPTASHAKIDKMSSRLEEDFGMFVDIPPGVRWSDLVL